MLIKAPIAGEDGKKWHIHKYRGMSEDGDRPYLGMNHPHVLAVECDRSTPLAVRDTSEAMESLSIRW